MDNTFSSPPNAAQDGRLWREEQEAYRFRGKVHNHAYAVFGLARRMWPGMGDEVIHSLKEIITEWLRAYPQHYATREHAAAHEAGHFIAYEACGLVAWSAEINGLPGQSGGWGGHATCMEQRLGGEPGTSLSEATVQAEGVLRFVGPAAECLLLDGPFDSFRVELIESCLCAAKLAELQSIRQKAAVLDMIVRTATLVDGYKDAIAEIANILVRRKRITHYQRDVKEVLDAVRCRPLRNLPEPRDASVEQLAAFIGQCPVSLGAAVKRILACALIKASQSQQSGDRRNPNRTSPTAHRDAES